MSDNVVTFCIIILSGYKQLNPLSTLLFIWLVFTSSSHTPGTQSSATLQLMCECCLYTYPPLSIARYSFIQLSELEQCRVKKLAQGLSPQHRI